MGTYRPVKGKDGAEIRNPDGSFQMEPDRRDPTTAEVREAMRRQHIAQTQAQMRRAGEERRYFTAPPPPVPVAPPPPTPEEMAASQVPLPQAAPPASPETQGTRLAQRPGSYPDQAGSIPAPATTTPEAPEAEAPPPKRARKPKKAPKRKGTPEKGLQPRECGWEGCQKGPGGLRKAFQPYRRYERFCSDECRDLARKAKARARYRKVKESAKSE
jgi:hypothetical protein